jgi:hypothetical protein
MRSSDPKYYIVPDGFIELRDARIKTVENVFGTKFVTPFTKQSLKTETIKKRRQRRVKAATRLLLDEFRSGKLQVYLLVGEDAQPIDASHWREWVPSWRSFESEALGVPGARVYLLKRNEWQRWVDWWHHKLVRPVKIVAKRQATDPPPKRPRGPGRPKGSGRYTDDPALVVLAENLLRRGVSNSVLNAAEQVAGNPNAPGYAARVERLRKKIKDPRVG